MNAHGDDTAYIQSLLDSGKRHITIGEGVYTISKPLIIHDDTALTLSAGAEMRLADGANCAILENDALPQRGTNRNITIEGGIWNGNNAGQTRRTREERFALTRYEEDFYYGILIRIVGVENFVFRNLTVKDPESYAIMITNAKYFTVENIRFDYNCLRPNMDGIHVQGTSRYGVIRNLQGNTNDDMVALNCDDTYACEITCGEISDIAIDGVFAECGYTAVRLLSCGHKLENISIRNIFGKYRYNAVSFTHHNVHPESRVREINNVLIDGVFACKADKNANDDGLIWIASTIRARDISIRDFHRAEAWDTRAHTIQIDEGARVDGLRLTNVTQRIPDEARPLILNKGEVNN